MLDFKQFIIPFEGLKLGKHNFVFEINEKFFEELKYPDFRKGTIKVTLELEKLSTMLMLNFSIDGIVLVECDRCSEDFNCSVKSTEQLIVKFGETNAEESDEVLVISSNQYELDLKQYLYEYILLAIPARRVHSESECDPEVIKFLNTNKKELKQSEVDPRWDILKKLN